ncbi:translation initiation factor eif-2b subunit gamma [Holotrichia oblita]|uniref:Translation initiation factor eif-2b subunit gamma n=1 Tax=Holotrichia oblita TaxID=644536 RepID=A0ACB9T5M4_HOLOL|nr:translation initiation factor eif-2b subunit gamma [Holotrichia oblita]
MLFKPEFQAVILAAGKGSRMPELTAGKPKCLLPVGSKPLIWYPLLKLQQSGFTDVILVVFENQRAEIQTAIDKTDLKIKVEYFALPSNEDLGTADTLRLLEEKLKSDVIVMSCDLITDINLNNILDLFRKHNASLCTLFFNPQVQEQIVVPGPKSKHKPERDLVGIDTQTNRLVFLASASDFETDVSLPKSLLRKHTYLNVYSNLIDSHLYIIKNWIVKYLKYDQNISTLKGELLPYIIKKQLAKPQKNTVTNTSIINIQDSNDIFQFAKEADLDISIRESSTYTDHFGDLKASYHGDPIRCYSYIADAKNFGIRINTLPAYWYINGKITDIWCDITNEKELIKIDSRADIKSNQVDDKCIIWESCKLNEKTSFKNSIIGANTVVNSFSRVFNSVVMNGVTIKEKVALENCIVCDGAIIESGSQLKGCLIGSNHTVPEQSQHCNEVLTKSDRLMEF